MTQEKDYRSGDSVSLEQAPERVTHEQARGYAAALPLVSAKHLLAYVAQQEADGNALKYWSTRARELEASGRARREQPEREVAELRKLVSTLRDEQREAVETQSRLMTERDTLRAKLSEAERKLGEALAGLDYERRARASESAFDDDACNCSPNHMHDCPAYRSPVAKEPTGVEPANSDDWSNVEPGPFNGPEYSLCPTPPAAEAEPRFRVGQRVRIERGWRGPRNISEVTVRSVREDGLWLTVGDGFAEWGVNSEDCSLLEPADPAPPKPGGFGPQSLAEVPAFISEAIKVDLELFRAELVKALRKVGNKHGTWEGAPLLSEVALELEREGSEKP